MHSFAQQPGCKLHEGRSPAVLVHGSVPGIGLTPRRATVDDSNEVTNKQTNKNTSERQVLDEKDDAGSQHLLSAGGETSTIPGTS